MKSNKFIKVFLNNKQAKFGSIVMFIFILFALFGSIVYPKVESDYLNTFAQISIQHPLGTDFAGKDTLAQFVNGTKDVLYIAVFSGVFTVGIGVLIGVISGYYGGIVDEILVLITDIVLTVPSFPVLMVMSLIFDASNPIIFGLMLSLWSWSGLAKSIRAQILSIKESDFIESSVILGLSKSHILRHDIMPQIIPFVLVNFVLVMKNSVLASVGLMMIGLAPFKGEHWGMMLNMAMTKSGAMFGSSALIYLLTPIVGIILFQMSCFMISKGIEDAFNPRKRSVLNG